MSGISQVMDFLLPSFCPMFIGCVPPHFKWVEGHAIFHPSTTKTNVVSAGNSLWQRLKGVEGVSYPTIPGERQEEVRGFIHGLSISSWAGGRYISPIANLSLDCQALAPREFHLRWGWLRVTRSGRALDRPTGRARREDEKKKNIALSYEIAQELQHWLWQGSNLRPSAVFTIVMQTRFHYATQSFLLTSPKGLWLFSSGTISQIWR